MWLYIKAKIANIEASLKYNIVCLCVLYVTNTSVVQTLDVQSHYALRHKPK